MMRKELYVSLGLLESTLLVLNSAGAKFRNFEEKVFTGVLFSRFGQKNTFCGSSCQLTFNALK